MINQNEKKEEIFAWLRGNVKDYAAGVALVGKYGSRSSERVYACSKPEYKLGSLISYLRHLAGLQPNEEVPASKASPRPAASAPQNRPATSASEAQQLPRAIVRAKAKLHDVWLRMNECHERLIALGTDNSDDTKAKRVAIMEERSPWIEAYNQLYEMKETYFALPPEDAVVPAGLVDLLDRLDGKTTIKEDKADYSALSDVELLKKIKAVRQAITRKQNKLRYQQDVPTADRTPNPMPDSPKRTRLEAEIAIHQKAFATLTNIKEQRGL